MNQWEYKIEVLNANDGMTDCHIEQWMNQFGAKGWELISARRGRSEWITVFTFKRSIVQPEYQLPGYSENTSYMVTP